MRTMFLLCAVLPFSLWAQTNPPASRSDLPAQPERVRVQSADSAVTITEDPSVKELMTDFTTRKHELKGYRVQIFLGADRDKAREVRRSFVVRHTEVGGYESYLAPNFRIRVGDLRTRLEAEKLLQQMRVEYPGSYLVQDVIELPRLAE